MVICPACTAHVTAETSTCPDCGRILLPHTQYAGRVVPIHHLGGKLQAIGTILLAFGLVSSLLGTWWGPALVFPGIVVFALGRLLPY